MSRVELCNDFAIGVTRLSVSAGSVKLQIRRSILGQDGAKHWEQISCLLLTPQETQELIKVLQEESAEETTG